MSVSTNEQKADGPAVPFDLVQSVVRMLEPYSPKDQRHVLETVTLWLRLSDIPQPAKQEGNPPATLGDQNARTDEYKFSGRPEATPKEFLLEKQPTTDVERLACLAYYLTHYRDQRFFKTDDLSKLNMEAAQRGFSNASLTAKNAWRDGFFVPAPKKGFRQLSALGEQYVQALPNYAAARELRKRMFRRRNSAKRGGSGPANSTEE